MKKNKKLVVKQLLSAQWDGNNGPTYTLHALGEDGIVYRYSLQRKEWMPYSMKIGNKW